MYQETIKGNKRHWSHNVLHQLFRYLATVHANATLCVQPKALESLRSAFTLNVVHYVTNCDVTSFTVQMVIYIRWNASSLNAGISLCTLQLKFIM